jgi:hypothetical protein
MRHAIPGLLAAMLWTAACAQAPTFDPSRLKGPVAGPANDVMVLGSPHLSTLPASFRPADLGLLLDRLAEWRPQTIAIEWLSGPQCHFMRAYPARYKDTIATFCWDPAPARAATGLDVPAATAESERLLAAWPADPAPAQRRRLAAMFLAGGERASALVQWLRLPVAERHAGDGLDAALVALLDQLLAKHDERVLVAAALAARLGLERVVAMDDHTADIPVADDAAYEAAITKAWDTPAGARRRQVEAALRAQLDTPEDVLALYRGYNAPTLAAQVFDSDFGAALREPSPQHFGRVYVTYWETRNLRMAANIRAAMSEHPGSRTLVVVGASHKWYLEAYLNQMHDTRIVDVGPLLR